MIRHLEEFVGGLFSDIASLGSNVVRPETLNNYYASGINETLISEDRGTTIMPFSMAGDFDVASDNITKVVEVVETFQIGQEEFEVLITGQPTIGLESREVGQKDLLRGKAFGVPIAIAYILGMSFLLLMIVFRSIVVPVKAIVMNLLSVASTYGILVLVFQKHVLHGALGFQQSDIIVAWISLFLFSILFGLSMDYHVFLLSRIRERFDQVGDNTDAVAYGMRSTGRLITGEALIMVSGVLGI